MILLNDSSITQILLKIDRQFIAKRIMTLEYYRIARFTTLHLDLPAVAGISKTCYRIIIDNETLEMRGVLKQVIGAEISCLREGNGF